MTKRNIVLSIEPHDLRRMFSYDLHTGFLYWKINIKGNVRSGDFAGTPSKGYWVVSIDGKKYSAHRIVWAMLFGEWPTNEIDHRNRNGFDNRQSNIRLSTTTENKWNSTTSRRNRSGHKGVSWCERDKAWRATIRIDKKQKSLGYYKSKDAAINARNGYAKNLHGEFYRA